MLLLAVIGLVVVGSIVAAAVAFMLPGAAEAAGRCAEIQRYALADRKLDDAALPASTIELPKGWVALRPDNPLVTDANARRSSPSPRSVRSPAPCSNRSRASPDPLDAYADRVLAQRRPAPLR